MEKAKSMQLDLMETNENACTKSPTLFIDSESNLNKNIESSMQEFHHPNKRKTCNDRLTISNLNTQNTNVYTKTLPREQISSVKACRPFWNKYTGELSKKLWSCIETDLHESELNSWNKYLTDLASNSWFTTKVKKTNQINATTLSQSSHYLLQAIMVNEQQKIKKEENEKEKKRLMTQERKNKRLKLDYENRKLRVENGWSDADKKHLDDLQKDYSRVENELLKQPSKKTKGLLTRIQNDIKKIKESYTLPTNNDETYEECEQNNTYQRESEKVHIRARKIKIHPNKEQKTLIDNWIDGSRFVYNKIVDLCNTLDGIHTISKTDRMRMYRDYISELMDIDEYKWLKSVPEQIRDDAIIRYEKAQKVNFVKWKKDNSFKWKMHFKSRKKMTQESISIRARDWGRKSGLFAWLRTVKANEVLPDTLDGALIITRTKLGDYYYSIPKEVKQEIHKKPMNDIIALDPGVRTFQTCYDTNGNVIEFGVGDMCRIFSLCRHADKLQSNWMKETNKKRKQRKKKAWLRMLKRIRAKVDELHRKVAAYLCKNYKVILLPEFKTSQMVKKGKRKLSNQTARSMCTWGHYRFRELLKNKVELYSNCSLIICDEHYTSKTCGSCGNLQSNLGSKKIYKCDKCSYIADRDANAARNILIRYISVNNLDRL